MTKFLFTSLIFLSSIASAQYWQQAIKYRMDVDFDVTTHQYDGEQVIEYVNNSPDTLNRLFFHLYFNAFQPGSMMDVRSRSIEDPDPRVGDRIEKLSEGEQGYCWIKKAKVNGVNSEVRIEGTIAEIILKEPILPGRKTMIETKFEAQVPLQIRRSGRDSKEGVAYSMTQWYPKLSEYDVDGWHPNPYIGREFYGVWGDFNVNITIDENYTIGGTGILMNANEIGHGYDGIDEKKKGVKGKLTWKFAASKVHDFAWAADDNYIHKYVSGPNDMEIHFLYKNDPEITENWEKLAEKAPKIFEIANGLFGTYPFKRYSIIQGGDGGMEYPMATLITGGRSLPGLVSVTIHEAMHSWYQMLLGTDEAQYSWMDEGFTTYASTMVKQKLNELENPNPFIRSIGSYAQLNKYGMEEPLTTHADHYITNRAYGAGSYTKGSLFLWQLENIVGKEVFYKGMKRYFNEWKFKHPDPRKFIRVMEKESGMVLDWYLEHWVGTINTIDYAVTELKDVNARANVVLKKEGDMPMPLEVLVEYLDGSTELFYIPLRIMRGEKSEFLTEADKVTQLKDWPWTHPYYQFALSKPANLVKSVAVDPVMGTCDINTENNIFPRNEGLIMTQD